MCYCCCYLLSLLRHSLYYTFCLVLCVCLLCMARDDLEETFSTLKETTERLSMDYKNRTRELQAQVSVVGVEAKQSEMCG